MKELAIARAVLVLFAFFVTGCDQRQGADNQTGRNETELSHNDTVTSPGQQLAEPATTAQNNPGSEEAGMVTSRNIVDNAAINKDLTTFTSLLRSANMVKTLSGTGPYTVLAPEEVAFRALPGNTLEDLMKPENQEQLQQILNNHIIAGKLTTLDLQDGAMLKTAAGQQLKVSKRDGQVMINGALLETQDGMSSNGVLHTINKVLIPAEE